MKLQVSIYFFSRDGDERSMKPQVYNYQTVNYNSTSDKYDFGISSMYEKLGPDGFSSYQKEDGNYILISKFGEGEYVCSGECQCEVGEERRNALSVSRGLIYLVAAASTLVAYGKARNHFEDECVSTLKDHCPLSAIKSDVDDCSIITDKVNDEISDDYDSGCSYWCVGYCVLSDEYHKILQKEYEQLEVDMALTGGDTAVDSPEISVLQEKKQMCETISKEGEVKVDNLDIMKAENRDDAARKKFMVQHLEGFCVREGQAKEGDHDMLQRMVLKWCSTDGCDFENFKGVTFCTGYAGWFQKWKESSNVSCRMIN